MAQPKWNGTNQNWTTGAEWSTNPAIPQPGDDVTIAQGDPQITSNVGTVNSVLDSATLSIENGGALTTTAGFSNVGTLGIDDGSGGHGSRLTVGTTLFNSGTLNIDNFYPGGGSALTVTGKLTDSGHINFGATNMTSASTMTLGDLDVTNGTLSVSGNTTASSTASATVTVTASVASTLNGTINLTGAAVLSYGGGSLATIGSNGNPTSGTLVLDGSAAQLVVKGRTGNENGLSLANVYGGLYLRDGATYTTPGALTVTGNLGIDDTGNAGMSSLTVSGALTNSGHITVANFFPNGGSSFTVTGKVTDTGSIILGATNLKLSISAAFGDLDVTGGSLSLLGNTTPGSTIKTSVTVTAAVASALNGTISIQGNAALTFGGGSITSIGATGTLTLDGPGAQLGVAGRSGNENGLALAAVYNNFNLRDGATYTTPGALTVTGTLGLDDTGSAAGSSLTVSGALTNSGGHINVANYYPNGGSSLTVTGKVTDTGTITFGATNLQTSITAQFGDLNVTGGTLSILGNTTQGTSATASVTVTASVAAALNGTIAIQGAASLTYGGGSITSIGAGGTLTIDGAGAQLKAAGHSGNDSGLALATVYNNFSLRDGATYTTPGALTVTGTLGLDDSGANGNSSLTVSGALTLSGHINIDNYYPNGGTTLTVTGKLTDTGTVTFGATNLQTSSTVLLGDLDVTGGTFSVLGNTTPGTSAMASATVTAAVATTLNGTLNIIGDAALAFNGGAIATIGTPGTLVLDGASTQLTAKGKTGATSGLALGVDNGTFAVRDGASYTTPAALAVSGNLDIDDTGGSGGSSLTVTGALTLASAAHLYMDSYFSSGGSSLTVTGKLTDMGQINFGGTSLQNAATIQLGDLDVTGGTFNITGNTTLGSPAMASVNVTASAASALNGTINLLGNAALTFGGGAIVSIGVNGVLSIDGASAQIGVTGGSGNTSALALASNGGKLTLADGVAAATPGALTNTGTLTLTGGSSLTVGGALTSSGALSVDATSTLSVQGAFQQGPGQLTLGIAQQGSQISTVTATGGLGLLGGALTVNTSSYTPAPTAFTLISFKAGALSGIFSSVAFAGAGGDSTTITLGGGLLAGVVYDNASGTIALDIVAAPTTTADTWAGGTGSWGTAASWSAGAPTFYSQVTIGGAAAGTVTLSTDATIDSLSLGASSSLTTASGTDLSIGNSLSIVSGAGFTVGGEAFVGRNVTNAGAVAVSGTLNVLGSSSGTGAYNVNAGAKLQFGGSVGNTVNFYGVGGKLTLGNGGAFSGTLLNFAAGDTADLMGVGIAVAGSPSAFTVTGEETIFTATSSGGTLRLVNTLNGNATLATYTLLGSYGSGVFALASDGGAGTLLGVTPTVALGLSAGVVVTSNIPGSAALAVVDKYNTDNSLYQEYTLTKQANGTYDYHYAGGSFFNGKSFAAFDNVVTASGTLLTQAEYNSAGKVIEGSTFNSNGSLYQQYTVSTLSNGNIDYHYQNGTFFNGKPYQSFDNVTTPGGVLVSQTLYNGSSQPIQVTQFNPNGSINIQATVTAPASGQLLYHYNTGSFFSGKSFSAFDNLQTTGNTLLEQILYNNDGSHSFTVPGSNLTLTAQKNDTFNVTGSNETTRFNATGFGADLFKGYAAGDIFSFATSIFPNYTALSQHVSGSSSAVITDAANDTLTLNGVAANSLNSSMFKFS